MGQVVLQGLARQLVSNAQISEEVAMQATADAHKAGEPFAHHVVAQSLVKSADLALTASQLYGTPLLDLNAFDLTRIPSDKLDRKIVIEARALPLFIRGKRLYVGLSDPTDLRALDAMQFASGLTTEAIVVEADKLAAAIENYGESSGSLGDLNDDGLDNIDLEDDSDTQTEDDPSDPGNDQPIVRFVNKMLLDAIRLGASDIHFEPYEKAYRIRYRVDGVLSEVTKPPVNMATRLAARIKVMSKMDISERRVPQDGRIKMKLSANKAIDFRVNTLPTLWGEKIVLRILDPSSAQLGIDALGYEPDQKDMYMKALAQPQGMILVTGPTGSGKTVSLYTGLNILNTPEVNISTAEDPVEINLEGINQTQVNTKVGLTFAEALRAFLRQDPDVVMVGEIRDLETAEIAIKASQTGHLVLSTLHTNSAPETLTRLRNMGVPAFNIATSVSLIIAQRLARRLCSHCKSAVELPPEALESEGLAPADIATHTLYEPVGCEHCMNGYKGRVGVYEVVRVTPAISEIIMREGNALELAKQCHLEGFKSLRQSGLQKVLQGVTSLQEINRVTKD
ncbi:type IV-A pilus assembly ATPase PilB [Litorivicinus lipolyticus]|uniref:Type IV-A pilus assembly ATPase PilB n=1 Tax=Litorivicinus lipolyticus TaxID=418701 RepID=A0A5Q2Q8D8_9GAMM|nr:type IV-A pilus assembly ATPase PilB [Litorivicinus lipolyticus]QGG80929.1 type IV-A pilus assembly ATPase PilB [Litorivicinus lipolyticus]